MTQFEKRKIERFDLELPALLSTMDQSGNQCVAEFMISNICSGGAFFETDNPLSVGTVVKMDLIIPLDKLKTAINRRSRVDVSGTVIRTESQGMAVCFDKKYSISPWK